jgi:hypothetical protein
MLEFVAATAAALVGTAALAATPPRLHTPVSATCAAPIGAPVDLAAEPIALAALGGASVPRPGWPPPGEPRVGALRYEWGLMLRSIAPGFADFDEAVVPIHSRRSGCWYGLDLHWGAHGADAVSKARIVAGPYREGYVRERPATVPAIPGYRFTAARGAFSPKYRWVGIWTAQRGRERSLMVAFDGLRRETLAEVPVRLAAISTLPSPDTPWLGITVIGTNRPGRPVPLLSFAWMSGLAGKASP